MDIYERINRLDAELNQPALTYGSTIADLAEILGVAKLEFVRIKARVPNFPPMLDEEAGSDQPDQYPTAAALRALQAYYASLAEEQAKPPASAAPSAMEGSVFDAVPQSEHKEGDMALPYTLQTFNELAAANTALLSELAGRDAVIVEKDAIIAQIRDHNKDLKDENERHEKAWNKLTKELSTAQGLWGDEKDSHAHTKRLLDAANQRVARASGYIDRVLDDEVRLDPPLKMPDRPMPPAPKGPALNDIWDPPAPSPRNASARSHDYFTEMASIPVRMAEGEYAPRRRY